MTNPELVAPEVKSQKIDWVTLAAFFAVAILGGSNAVAVRISNFDLPPFHVPNPLSVDWRFPAG